MTINYFPNAGQAQYILCLFGEQNVLLLEHFKASSYLHLDEPEIL